MPRVQNNTLAGPARQTNATRSTQNAKSARPVDVSDVRNSDNRRNVVSGQQARSATPAPPALPVPTPSAAPAPSPSASPARAPSVTTEQPAGSVSKKTENMTEAQKYDHYKQIVEKNGGKVSETGPNIIAERKETNSKTNNGKGAYDDNMSIIWKDKDGNGKAREFRGNTEPIGRFEDHKIHGGEDANGDGRKDQGRLRTGHYEYKQKPFSDKFEPTSDGPVDRDANHDGKFGNDGGASTKGAKSMQIHSAYKDDAGSAGCQTMSPDEYKRFTSTLSEGGLGRMNNLSDIVTNDHRKVGYTLVDE
jgi:hypothetical protein